MICPNCKAELVTSERQNVQIDHCPNCQGVWLDRGELEKILQMDASGGSQSERYNRRNDNDDDDNTSRRRGSRDVSGDDDDDDDRGAERGSYRSRERDDDDDERGSERGGSYGDRDGGYNQRSGERGSEGRSIWRDIFDTLSEKIPNLGDKIPRP